MKNKNKQTKFPVARIKKIMQKDEEVGKVAQATPIVISKALEMFLALIIDQASKVTNERGAKKVEAYHLKHAVETTEMLDFLKEIVEAVPDPSAGGTIDLEGEASEGKKKKGKRKRGAVAVDVGGAEPTPTSKRRRKKKGEDDAAGSGEPTYEEGGAAAAEAEGESKSEHEHEHERETQKNGDGDVAMKTDEFGYDGRQKKKQRKKTFHDEDESHSEDDWDSNKPYMPRR